MIITESNKSFSEEGREGKNVNQGIAQRHLPGGSIQWSFFNVSVANVGGEDFHINLFWDQEKWISAQCFLPRPITDPWGIHA